MSFLDEEKRRLYRTLKEQDADIIDIDDELDSILERVNEVEEERDDLDAISACWTGKNGARTLPKEMFTDHIRNCINMMLLKEELWINKSKYEELSEVPVFRALVREYAKRTQNKEEDIMNQTFETANFNNYRKLPMEKLVQYLRLLLIFNAVAETNKDVPELAELGDKKYSEWIDIYKSEIKIRKKELLENEKIKIEQELSKLRSKEDKVKDLNKRLDAINKDLGIALPKGKERGSNG